jgi:hypothetical protein
MTQYIGDNAKPFSAVRQHQQRSGGDPARLLAWIAGSRVFLRRPMLDIKD